MFAGPFSAPTNRYEAIRREIADGEMAASIQEQLVDIADALEKATSNSRVEALKEEVVRLRDHNIVLARENKMLRGENIRLEASMASVEESSLAPVIDKAGA